MPKQSTDAATPAPTPPRPVAVLTTQRNVTIGHVLHELPDTRLFVHPDRAAELVAAGVARLAPTVRLRMLTEGLVGSTNRGPGDLVEVLDDMAGVLVGSGQAELLEGESLGKEGNENRMRQEAKREKRNPPPDPRLIPVVAPPSPTVQVRTVVDGVQCNSTIHPAGVVLTFPFDRAADLVGIREVVLEKPFRLADLDQARIARLRRRGAWDPIEPAK